MLYDTDSVGDKNGVMNCVGVGVRTGAYAFASSAFLCCTVTVGVKQRLGAFAHECVHTQTHTGTHTHTGTRTHTHTGTHARSLAPTLARAQAPTRTHALGRTHTHSTIHTILKLFIDKQ